MSPCADHKAAGKKKSGTKEVPIDIESETVLELCFDLYYWYGSDFRFLILLIPEIVDCLDVSVAGLCIWGASGLLGF